MPTHIPHHSALLFVLLLILMLKSSYFGYIMIICVYNREREIKTRIPTLFFFCYPNFAFFGASSRKSMLKAKLFSVLRIGRKNCRLTWNLAYAWHNKRKQKHTYTSTTCMMMAQETKLVINLHKRFLAGFVWISLLCGSDFFPASILGLIRQSTVLSTFSPCVCVLGRFFRMCTRHSHIRIVARYVSRVLWSFVVIKSHIYGEKCV